MANSYAFVLSKNTYPDAWQANNFGVEQGTRIVYAETDTLTSESILYSNSRLTQPIYGNPDLWLGVQLLTDDEVKYPIEISTSGSINIGSGTTTTTAGPTTTTTAAPTTTTTAAPPASTLYISTISSGDACAQTGPIVTLTSITYNGGTGFCDSNSLNSPDVDSTSGGNYWVSDGTNYRTYNKVPGGGITLITFTGPCVSC